jgi:transcriptional regulator with XRE-family HTH domain
MAHIGHRIKMHRLNRNMTQNTLAIECELEKANVSRLESGQTNPTVRTLYRISSALNVSIMEFFKE